MLKRRYSNIYFLGIGGIGMSALARYFKSKGVFVGGYDKTPSKLTKQLENEGIMIHYEDLGANVLELVGDKESTLVVLTPAIPQDMKELISLEKEGYIIHKRAKVLGLISEDWKTLAVAGTHGKTTTSTMLAYVLSNSVQRCSAFLGGISANFDSNLVLDENAEWLVVEADEYDRSFHQLKPFSAIITSTEADHLDIYHDEKNMNEAFEEFTQLISSNGKLIAHYKVNVGKNMPRITYGIGEDIHADYQGINLRVVDGFFTMDVITPTRKHGNIQLGLPGTHNAENALAVIALTESIGLKLEEIKPYLQSFKGVKRRFEVIVQKDDIIYIDDYAHHPTAIKKLIESVRMIYSNQSIHIIFQPHLFTRTRDFMKEFAASLKLSDEVVLMPIYPARELPIEGVTSRALADMIGSHVHVLESNEVLEYVKHIKEGVLLTVGAGNIDRLVEQISEILA
ncbi:MAG: UDP-N-acetylmuramate--L-alanine ligase [Brumimicrobium sp.]